MKNKIKLLLWGIGRDYNRRLNLLKFEESQGNIDIVGISDNDMPDLWEIDGWKVYKTSELHALDIDFCMVMSDKYFSEIFNSLSAYGIEDEQILSSKILDIPYFNWDKYLKIQKNNLSIICNNCVGGILYNTLGLKCQSPCKNLSIPDDSFLKLVQNLERYMSLEPKFERWQRDPHSREMFPVIALDDIEIWCNHDQIFCEAREKWNRRKKRINYQNIMLMMYTENDEVGRKFLELTGHRKILFVPEKSKLEDQAAFKLKLFPAQKEFWETVISSASLGKNSCSYKLLDMLNGERKYRNSVGRKT